MHIATCHGLKDFVILQEKSDWWTCRSREWCCRACLDQALERRRVCETFKNVCLAMDHCPLRFWKEDILCEIMCRLQLERCGAPVSEACGEAAWQAAGVELKTTSVR